MLFDYALLCSMSYAPNFCRIEGLIMIHDHGKFHGYRIGGFQVKLFNVFRVDSASMKWTFLGGFWGPYSPKYGLIMTKFLPGVLFTEKKKEIF